MEDFERYLQAFFKARLAETTREEMAKRLELSTRQISYISTGERSVSKKVSGKLSRLYGLTYQQILNKGKQLLEEQTEEHEQDNKEWPYASQLSQYGKWTPERAEAIRLFACKEAGVEADFMNETFPEIGHVDELLDQYLKRKLTSREYFEAYRASLRESVQFVRAQLVRLKELERKIKKKE